MTLELPNGNEPNEIILPNGNPATEVLSPDGSVVWTAGIPDSAVAWYDATALTLTDGSEVTNWGDETTEGNDLSGTGATYQTGVQNGNAVVRFDGTDDHLTRSDANYTDLTQPITIICVVVDAAQGGSFERIVWRPNTDDSSFGLSWNASNSTWDIWAGNNVYGG